MFYFLRNPQYDVVKLFFFIVAIIALGVFIVFNTNLRNNFNPAQVIDLIAPSIPTNLAVQSTTSSSATLSWDPSSDDSGDVAEYTVYQITGEDEEEIPICDPDVAGTPGTLRYCNEIFDQSEIPDPISREFSETYNLSFDLYTPPLSDIVTNRPLKIFMHGGGGEAEGGAAPCNEAARLGYVCISGDYRTDHTNMGFTMSEQKHAASDMLALIRFARIHASEYGIDPNKILLAGTSAGGITSMLAAATANDASFYPSSDALVNRDNQMYQSSIVPSWSCMVTSTSGPLAPFAYDYIDANDPPSVFFLGGEDTTHGWHCSDPDDSQNDDGDEALGIMQSFGIPSYFKCFDDSGHGLGEDAAMDKIVIPTAYKELIVESCPQSYSNLSHIID
ncbi:alpha/beta hydrolase fold domain-containing protein [Candidatus Nomurabacteria bacterium]|jgi:dienelactone hydrolase|nr:MAG: alpha/beta hydrolase fold domain-containing protein [Candidatus Nomurabacteria bacterium]